MVLVAGCSTRPRPDAAAATGTTTYAANHREPSPPDLVPVTVDLDEPHQALVPAGWTLSVWARTSKPRLAAWAPDGALLVSVPSTGQVLHYAPGDGGPRESVLLDGLDQPHGLAFAGNTLYVAESDQIDAYDYADGAATNQRTVAANLPDARSPDLRGAYSHALKSVAVGPDGAVYFSIGSTGNISADDRTATPPRATIMRIPPGGGPAQAVRHRRAQRNRAGDRAGRFGVDGGQQSRQRRPTRRPARSPWTTSTTIRPRPSPN